MKYLQTKSRLQILSILAMLMFVLLSGSTATAQLIAERITTSNAGECLPECPDRRGGIGDWYLSNGIIWAIIDDVSNQNIMCPSGGTLVDLGLVNPKAEQFTQMMQLLNMTRDLVIPYDLIRADKGNNWASITVSVSHGLQPEREGFGVLSKDAAEKILVETEYKLVTGENFLRVNTTVKNVGNKRARIFFVGDVIYWGDDTLKPFAGSEKRLGRARGNPRGFQHPDLDTSSIFSLVRGVGGFTYVAAGGVEGLGPISYGLCSPASYKKKELVWGVNDRLVTAAGVFTGKFNRPLDLWKIFFFGIRPGEQFTYERVLVVGGNNDVASATDTIFQLLGKAQENTGVVGRIEPPDADASVTIFTDENELPVTQIRPMREGDQTGLIRAVLPPGDYLAKIRSAERDPDLATSSLEPVTKHFTVYENRFTNIGTTNLPSISTLSVEAFEGDQRSPARIIIRGEGGTPDPELGADLLGFTVGGKATPSTYAANWILLDGNETKPTHVELRPGKYTLYATRGFEYSVDKKQIDLSQPGSEAYARMSLSRVIDTPGMMCGDFHVHSVASMDSALPQEQRIFSVVADGLDLLIATDHDVVTDYKPTIEKLKLSNRLTSIVGVEATTMLMIRGTPFTIGHYNAWPLRYEPALPRRGMPLDEGIRPRDLYDRLRKNSEGKSLIQVNHGRGREPDGGLSYFNALGQEFGKPVVYDPTRPLTDSPNNSLMVANANGTRDIDFDAMELLNGTAYDEYLLLRSDWFSLLNQGYVKTATANSDSHIKTSLVGYPRNYILLEDAQAEHASQDEIVEQIRKQKVFCSTGPIIKFDINGEAQIGDTITSKNGTVNLNIKVLAPTWVPLDEVSIFANGERVGVFKAGPQSNVMRFDQTVPIPVDKDTWFMVEATTADLANSQIPQPPGALYNIIAPGFVPLAFTNPIFVDVDGNGRYDPPGIPSSPTVSLPTKATKASVIAAFLALAFAIGYFRRKRKLP